jgi:4-diphosphocytidyl-2-C-methyl-D-erythritol kinase
MIHEQAFAKVNLTLEVLGRRADGYHELFSLVAFALDAFDTITVDTETGYGLDAAGPFGGAIEGDNLIAKAARLASQRYPSFQIGHFTLDKALPVAAGVGGGSADAAAALRAIARQNGVASLAADIGPLCPEIGADVAVCLDSHDGGGAYMAGTGEIVMRPAPPQRVLPANVHAVLVNPGVAVPTGEVFRSLNAQPWSGSPASTRTRATPSFATLDALIAYLADAGNDLEAPAIVIAPEIADVLSRLRETRRCHIARMSGSGATCFGLYGDAEDAARASAEIARQHPTWWTVATRLG